MKKNALMEAAAEILKGSHASAPKEEMHKAPVEVQDLGGTTTDKNVSAALDPHAKEATPPGAQPESSTEEPMHKVAGPSELDPTQETDAHDAEAEERKSRIEAGLAAGDLSEEWKSSLKEDVQKILASETSLPKEFAEKVATIYEARVTDKVSTIEESMLKAFSEQFEEEFQKAVLELRTELTEQVNSYLNYVVENWMKENELAVEQGIRTELTEEFIEGLRNLFAEHYIDIPEDKVDVVGELSAKVEELNGQLSEQMGKNVELSKQLTEAKKQDVLKSVCEGLTQTQAEKVKTLAESVEFTAEGEYSQKVTTIRENYFPVSEPKKVDAKVLTEATEVPSDEVKKSASVIDPDVARVADAIKRHTR